MARIEPFRALRYDRHSVELGNVLAPPYDVVAGDERGLLYDRDPHNAVRLELTRHVEDEAETDYSDVREILGAWQASGVLVRDERPALYVLRQTFEAPGGDGFLSREGFFTALELEEYAKRIVRPHERTLAGPKADRLRVMRATRANLSPIFMLYEDREGFLASILSQALESPQAIEADDGSGVVHRLAPLTDPDAIARVQDFLAERPVVIADGHHRYETSLAYRDERRAVALEGEPTPYEATLVFLANAFSSGSLLLPIHRVIRKEGAPPPEAWSTKLPGWSSKAVALESHSSIRECLEVHLTPLADSPSFAADDASGTVRVFWQDEKLDGRLMVRILEEQVIGNVFGLDPEAIRDGAVSFPKSAERAALAVREGEGSVALYLNPLRPEDVFRVTAAGEVMPQKSTFFAPKIPTGLIFRAEESP